MPQPLETQDFLSYDLNQKLLILQSQSPNSKDRRVFGFDGIFTEQHTQGQIFIDTGQKLVKDVINGYNGTIFAYGQTGSGKTHTMSGPWKDQDQKGLIPRCFSQLLVEAKENSNRDFLIMCSFIELYNEQIRDLLHTGEKTKLELRESPEQGLFIKDVKKLAITTEEEMMRYLKIGVNNRTTAETSMNSQSSRSHSILTIYVESLEKKDDGTNKLMGSKFNLVDLAGSERQSKTNAVGERFLEATKINLSLTALGKVISCLVQGKGTFIPYRDSKLTRLLQDSLGGNAKTVMIATISPLISSYEQTVSTLKYASKAKYITNAPVINQDPKDALLLEYQKQIKILRGQLSELQLPAELNQLKEQNEKLSKQAQAQKNQLLSKIRSLQQQLISSPQQLSKKLLNERNKRQQKLSFMQTNYLNLQQEVKEMRELLVDLRRKYKNASKQIFQLQNDYQKQKQLIIDENVRLARDNAVCKSLLSVLFTPKQLNHIVGLGSWEDALTFKVPQFYFKDRHTLAFPWDGEDNLQGITSRGSQRNLKRSVQLREGRMGSNFRSTGKLFNVRRN